MNHFVALAIMLIATYVIVHHINQAFRKHNRQPQMRSVSCKCSWNGQTERLPARCPRCRQLIGLTRPRPSDNA